MATKMATERVHNMPAGQHLRCEACGSEIEIVRACTCETADQVFQCCSQDMRPVDLIAAEESRRP
jgi:hypothetical protein